MREDDPSGRDRTAIIVSGAHRSGATTMARVFERLGARVIPPGRAGAARRDRLRTVADLNEQVLERFESWWAGWESIDEDELLSLVRLVERARRLVRTHAGDEGPVVLQDPQLSRLMPLWTRALEQEGFRCVHVVALRHPRVATRSMMRRDGVGRKAAALPWLGLSLDAERHTRNHPRVFVSLDNLLRDWRSEVDRVSSALDLRWPTAPDEVAGAVEELLDGAGRPDASQSEHTAGPVAVISPVHDVLGRWSEDVVHADDVQVLESWHTALRPVRRPRSAVAHLSTERSHALADARAKGQPGGRLSSAELWSRIELEAHDLEAEAAWAWLMRERQHAGAAGQAPARSGRLDGRLVRRAVPAKVRRMVRRLTRTGSVAQGSPASEQGREPRGSR